MADKKQLDYFFKLAHSRKTTYEFSDKKIKSSDIKKILEVARLAPSCLNIQPWQFIIVKNKDKISKLMETASYGGFHSDPTLIIAVVLDKGCWENADYKGKFDISGAYLSIAMPILSMVFEAEELGISSAILTPNKKYASKILKTPSEESIPVMIGLGYERKGAYQKKKERNPLRTIIFKESYGK